MGERNIEVKVGIVIIISLVLLVGFIFILGDFKMGEAIEVYIDFDNAADLKPGAPVKIAGENAGRVERIEYWGGKKDPELKRTDKTVWIRVMVQIEPDKLDSIHVDAIGYITTLGLLGEKYIELEPGTLEKPTIESGAKLVGKSPPRFDKMVLNIGDLLDSLALGVKRDPEIIFKILININELLEHGDQLVQENRPRIARLMDRMDKLSAKLDKIADEADKALAMLNAEMEPGADVRVTLQNIRAITNDVRREVPSLTKNIKSLMGKGELLVDNANATIDGVKQDVPILMDKTKEILGDVKQVTGSVKSGQGLVGKLLSDDELYDDIKEMLKDLKRHPWKIIWKE